MNTHVHPARDLVESTNQLNLGKGEKKEHIALSGKIWAYSEILMGVLAINSLVALELSICLKNP